MLECFAWYCAGEIVGRGFAFTGSKDQILRWTSYNLKLDVPEMRLVRNIIQLGSAYFAARIDAHLLEARYRFCSDRDLLRNRDDNGISVQENSETWSSDDRVAVSNRWAIIY